MNVNQKLVRPNTFQRGIPYFYSDETQAPGSFVNPRKMTPIRFVTYDVCPAYIIVKNGSGERWRCPRDNIYEVFALV